MRGKKKIKYGLTDTELIDKYERGKINLKKPIERMLKTRTKSATLKRKKKA